MVPTKLIPTGFDNGGSQALTEDRWIGWRWETYMSGVDRKKKMIEKDSELRISIPGESAVQKSARNRALQSYGRTLNPACDVETILTILRNALDVHNSVKAALAPDAGVDKIAPTLKTKLFIHSIGVTDNGYSLESIDFGGSPSGKPGTWISRFLYGVSEAFLFDHSVADNKGAKPYDMKRLSDIAESFFGKDVQSGNNILLGVDGSEVYAKNMKIFMDRLWNRSFKVVDAVVTRKRPDKYPRWYGTQVPVTPEVFEVCNKSQPYFGEWERAKKRLKI